MNYTIKSFADLTLSEFYQIVQERIAVFVVEQNCPYQEIDEQDDTALHLAFRSDSGELAAYARIYQAEEAIHFGRVLVKESYRQQGLGQELIAATLAEIAIRFPEQSIVIGAQAHLQEFYGRFGFKPISEVYLEDDIPHLDMQK